MYYRQGEWSTRGADGTGTLASSSRAASVLEVGKITLLACLFLVCGASWFVDPFAPTNSGPAGYLGLPFDAGGLAARELYCKPLDREAQLCRKEHPAPPPKRDDEKSWLEQLAEKGGHKEAVSGSGSSGWQSLLQLGSGLVSSSSSSSSSDDACAQAKERASACGQAARKARETVQLWCSSEVSTAIHGAGCCRYMRVCMRVVVREAV